MIGNGSVLMSKWFSIDSPLMVGLSKLSDLVILSFLWFVCCIPVVTIGASTTAMYYVAMKIVRNEEDVKVTSTFFHGFKSNFKQATALNLISLALGAVLAADCWYWFFAKGSMATISFGIFAAMFIWLLCIMFYVYPLQAQFYNTVKQTLINGAILSMRKFPITVIIFVLNILPLILGFFSLTLLVQTLPIWILLAPGVVAVINSKFFVKMFDPFLKAAKEQQEAPEETAEETEV